MSSTDKQGSSLGSFPTFPPLYPHFNWPSGFWPCVKSCLVGGSDKYYNKSSVISDSISPKLTKIICVRESFKLYHSEIWLKPVFRWNLSPSLSLRCKNDACRVYSYCDKLFCVGIHRRQMPVACIPIATNCFALAYIGDRCLSRVFLLRQTVLRWHTSETDACRVYSYCDKLFCVGIHRRQMPVACIPIATNCFALAYIGDRCLSRVFLLRQTVLRWHTSRQMPVACIPIATNCFALAYIGDRCLSRVFLLRQTVLRWHTSETDACRVYSYCDKLFCVGIHRRQMPVACIPIATNCFALAYIGDRCLSRVFLLRQTVLRWHTSETDACRVYSYCDKLFCVGIHRRQMPVACIPIATNCFALAYIGDRCLSRVFLLRQTVLRWHTSETDACRVYSYCDKLFCVGIHRRQMPVACIPIATNCFALAYIGDSLKFVFLLGWLQTKHWNKLYPSLVSPKRDFSHG